MTQATQSEQDLFTQTVKNVEKKAKDEHGRIERARTISSHDEELSWYSPSFADYGYRAMQVQQVQYDENVLDQREKDIDEISK